MEFSLKVGNHKVGRANKKVGYLSKVLLKGCVGVSRLCPYLRLATGFPNGYTLLVFYLVFFKGSKSSFRNLIFNLISLTKNLSSKNDKKYPNLITSLKIINEVK
jgi:hypothetical protein